MRNQSKLLINKVGFDMLAAMLSPRALFLLAIALTAPQARAGDGGGINGPSMNPVSIPVATDRGLTKDQINLAVNYCGVTGDLDHGVRPLMVRFLQDIHGGSIQDWKHAYRVPQNSAVWEDRQEKRLRLDVSGRFVAPDGSSGNVSFDAAARDNSHTELNVTLVEISDSKIGDGSTNYLITKQEKSFMPYLTFQSEEIVYGELGEEKEIHFVGLELHIPNSPAQAIPLFNGDRSTSASLKIGEYVDCLRANLGK